MADEWNQTKPDSYASPQNGLPVATPLDGAAPPAPPRRKSSALPWVLGCGGGILAVLLVVGILAGLMLPAVSKVRESARRAACKSNLRQIGLAIHMWSDDNDEKFPPDFLSLYPNYVDNPKIFSCPSSPSNYRDFASGSVDADSSSYTYLPGREATFPGSFVMAHSRSEDNHGGSGFNVLFCDAHVEWWRASQLKEFNKLLDAQDAVVRKIQKDPDNAAKYFREYDAGAGNPRF